MCLFGLGAVCWALWKVRNKMMIEHKLVKSPRVVIFNIIVLLQQWKVLLPTDCQDTVEAAVAEIRKKMKPSKKGRNR
jgi:hypothetical protein